MLTHLWPQGPARLLLLIDEPLLGRAVALALTHGSFMTRIEADPAGTIVAQWNWHPYLIVCDLDAQGGRWVPELMEANRPAEGRAPILALTRQLDLKTKLEAFRLGGDDVLTLPFAPEELLARVVAVMRRTYQKESEIQPVITLEDLKIDILNRRVGVGGHEIRMTSLELSILYLLAANVVHVLSRTDITNQMWDPATLRKATSSTATSASSGSNSTTAPADRGSSSTRCLARGTASASSSLVGRHAPPRGMGRGGARATYGNRSILQ